MRGIPSSGVRRVAIVPDGVLCLLPFEALPMDRGGTLLIERMPVWYLPSASLLLGDEVSHRALGPWRRPVAAFGDRSGTLPDAAGELRFIASALPGRAALYGGLTDMKRDLLGDALAGVPLLHFATHATIDLADSNRSRIQFTPEPNNPA